MLRLRNFLRAGGLRAMLLAALSFYALCLLLLSLQQIVRPAYMGVLALAEVFAPFLFLPLLLALPLAVRRGAIWPRAMLLLGGLLFLLRFDPLPPLRQATQEGAAAQLNVLGWNVLDGGNYPAIQSLLLSRSADIVSLEEVYPAPLQDDAALAQLYPYRLVAPAGRDNTTIVVLSKFPINESGVLGTGSPQAVWLHLTMPDGAALTVIAVHTIRPFLGSGWCPSIVACYDTRQRDALLAEVAAFVDNATQQGQRILMLGDFNLTDREPAYRPLAARLQDVQRTVGSGLVGTWRPAKYSNLPLALLRIDYMFSSTNLPPLSFAVDCTQRSSDHCATQGRFALR